MRFLGDMGISPKVISKLRSMGHDAVHLHELGLDRSADDDILEKARQERRILLTHDLDFGYLLAVSGASAPSIVLFRLSDMRADVVFGRLNSIMPQLSELELGSFVTVTDSGIRIRYLPIDKTTN